MEKVCVVGMGKIGLPLALIFAKHGLATVGVDSNYEVVHALSNGVLHGEEPGLREYFDQVKTSGNISFSQSIQEADIFLIATPTPFVPGKYESYRAIFYRQINTSSVAEAAHGIVPRLQKGNLVVVASFLPPRAIVDLVRPILQKSGLDRWGDFFLAYCHERPMPGQILHDLVYNVRLVGGIDAESAEMAYRLYRRFAKGEIVLSDSVRAEIVELMDNTS